MTDPNAVPLFPKDHPPADSAPPDFAPPPPAYPDDEPAEFAVPVAEAMSPGPVVTGFEPPQVPPEEPAQESPRESDEIHALLTPAPKSRRLQLAGIAVVALGFAAMASFIPRGHPAPRDVAATPAPPPAAALPESPAKPVEPPAKPDAAARDPLEDDPRIRPDPKADPAADDKSVPAKPPATNWGDLATMKLPEPPARGAPPTLPAENAPVVPPAPEEVAPRDSDTAPEPLAMKLPVAPKPVENRVGGPGLPPLSGDKPKLPLPNVDTPMPVPDLNLVQAKNETPAAPAQPILPIPTMPALPATPVVPPVATPLEVKPLVAPPVAPAPMKLPLVDPLAPPATAKTAAPLIPPMPTPADTKAKPDAPPALPLAISPQSLPALPSDPKPTAKPAGFTETTAPPAAPQPAPSAPAPAKVDPPSTPKPFNMDLPPALPPAAVPPAAATPVARETVPADPAVRRAEYDINLVPARRGDSYDAVAKDSLGDAKYGPALRRYNNDRELRAGDVVRVPPVAVLRKLAAPNWVGAADKPGVAGPRTYVTPRDGMSMWDIAYEVYGTKSEFRKVIDANRERNPNLRYRAGERFRLPAE